MIRHPVLLSRQEPVLPVSPLVLRVLPQPVPTMLTTRLRRLTSRLARLPPNPKPMLLLRPRCLCAAVCRASKAESRGLRKVSLLPERRPPVLLLHPPRRLKPLLPKSQSPKRMPLSRIRPRNRQPSSRTRSLRPPRLLALLSQPLLPVMSRLRQNLPPTPLPLAALLLLPKFPCVAVCRASKAENPGRRKASHPPESRPLVARPPVLLRQRLRPHLLRAPRRNLLLSPTPPKPPRLIRQPIPRLNRHPLLPRPPLLARVLPVPVWPQLLLAARAPESFPTFRCVADFPAPPGETPGRRKASLRQRQ